MTIKIDHQSIDITRDIVNEADSGCDVIMIRGQSALKEFIPESISQKVLHSVRDKSVVIGS